MSYATNQNIVDRLGTTLAAQLTTEDSSTTPDQDLITTARSYAEGEIDGYLGRRYKIPVDVSRDARTAALLRGHTITITVYRLHTGRPSVPERVTKDYESAIAWLEKVATGDVVLPAAVELAGPDSHGPVGEAYGRDVMDWLDL